MTIFILVYNLCYWNLGSISLIVWKRCAFRQHWQYQLFSAVFSSWFSTEKEIWNSDGFIGKIKFSSIRIYPIWKNVSRKSIYWWKIKFFRVFVAIFFLELFPKFSDFSNFDDCIGKRTLKSIRLQQVYIEKMIFCL